MDGVIFAHIYIYNQKNGGAELVEFMPEGWTWESLMNTVSKHTLEHPFDSIFVEFKFE